MMYIQNPYTFKTCNITTIHLDSISGLLWSVHHTYIITYIDSCRTSYTPTYARLNTYKTLNNAKMSAVWPLFEPFQPSIG